MFKKSLLTLTLMALVGMITAQTLQFEYEGTVYTSGQTIICQYDSTMFEYIQHMRIRNISDRNLNVVVEQNVIETCDDALVSLCWGVCAAPNDHIVCPAVPIPAQTLSEEDLSFHCMFPMEETGVVTVKYDAYDENHPDYKISLIVLSGKGANVAENSISFGHAYPNPATTQVHFDLKGSSHDDLNVVVYNLLGQEVKSQLVSGSQGRINIAVDNLQPGIYFCSFQVNNKVVKTEKFIVKR